MRTKRRNGGRPRTRERVAKVYVGGYVDDEIADTLDDICDAIGQSRSQIIGDMVRAYVESNMHRATPQHQEALIAS